MLKKKSKGHCGPHEPDLIFSFFVDRSSLLHDHALRALDGFGLIEAFHCFLTQVGGNGSGCFTPCRELCNGQPGRLVAKDARAALITAAVQAP